MPEKSNNSKLSIQLRVINNKLKVYINEEIKKLKRMSEELDFNNLYFTQKMLRRIRDLGFNCSHNVLSKQWRIWSYKHGQMITDVIVSYSTEDIYKWLVIQEKKRDIDVKLRLQNQESNQKKS